MKRFVPFLWLALLGVIACTEKKLMTNEEQEICTSISFDPEIGESIKTFTKDTIDRLPRVDEYGDLTRETSNGLSSAVADETGLEFVLREKEKFRSKGYLLFLFEDNVGKPFIGTIKGTDDLDIIRWRQTNGVNHGIENKDITAKLAEWKQLNDFVVMGVGMDWLQFKFRTMPDNINAFAAEVYEFCPDIIDQGAGDMETLIEEIQRTGLLFLWWD